MTTTYSTLINAAQLQALQATGSPLMVFDCSFELTQADAGPAQFAQTHIAGARYADLNQALSVHTEGAPRASGGRHPLPTREAFAKWLGQMGFQNGMQAVVYDRQGANYCGRLWWMLQWLGHEAVAVLDGGLQAWQAAGGAVQSGSAPTATPSSFAIAPARVELVTVQDMVQRMTQGRPIIDARGAPRYRGEVEPLDPVAGHIPGALNRVFTSNLDANGFFKPAATLRTEFEALLGQRDATDVTHHCGSGVSAIPNVLAMEIAGLGRSALFAGSWSEWTADPARPVAQG
ncbi:MAG: sulfurtransferase [Rhodoferax sp.]|nr:sulfurtransferase [Rhodoferax sp.]